MTSPMKGLLKGLRYIARIFEDEKEPEMQIGQPTDVKHVAHIGWEGPSATTPSWMHEYKSPMGEPKASSNKKSAGEKQRNKGRRKASTGVNSPSESPSRAGGSTRPSRRGAGKQREQSTGSGSESGSGLEIPLQNDQSMGPKHSKQRKSKGTGVGGGGGGGGEAPPPPVGSARSKETDISVRAVYPCVGLGSSTGR